MLTKDLLNFRRSGEYIKPVFINTGDQKLQDIARNLLALYDIPEGESTGLTMRELEELSEPIIKTQRNLKLAKGLNKLILDRCEFSAPPEHDFQALRSQVFSRSAELLKDKSFELDYQEYRDGVANAPELDEFINQDIYADLPENERLIRFRKLFPQELLDRYNCAQVQSLLLYCDKLELVIVESDQAKLRRLFKYLKFFRLLASVHAKPPPKGNKEARHLKMIVDGPASLFENTRKYGLQLASFFPAVCDLEKWTLRAHIKLRNDQRTLRLDQKSGLKSHYHNFSAYVPEEVRMFHQLFKQKIEVWQIVGDTPFMDAGNGELIFPDLSFKHESGPVLHLELFHRWHTTQLLRRLEFCRQNNPDNFIIGVDRSLAKRPELKEILASSEFFENRGFLYRDFPGVDRVKKLLDISLN
jgi:uncharacterized protein